MGAIRCTGNPCAPGKFAAQVATHMCYDCPAGKYNMMPGGWDECFACEAGQYQEDVGQASCKKQVKP